MTVTEKGPRMRQVLPQQRGTSDGPSLTTATGLDCGCQNAPSNEGLMRLELKQTALHHATCERGVGRLGTQHLACVWG